MGNISSFRWHYFAHILVHYFKIRITSVGYIFVYRSPRLAARFKWPWKSLTTHPYFQKAVPHTIFHAAAGRRMNGNEWMRNFTYHHRLPSFPYTSVYVCMASTHFSSQSTSIRIHVHDWSFLIAGVLCPLHLYLNVFKRPTIWEHRRCQWQRSLIYSLTKDTPGGGTRWDSDSTPQGSCSPVPVVCAYTLWLWLLGPR